MQIKVTLTDSDCKAIQAMAAGDQNYWECLAATLKHDAPAERAPGWLIKLAQALNPTPKAPSKIKSLWAAIARPELKKLLSVATYQFGVPAYWRLNSDTNEACAHCARPLGHARLVPVSAMGEVPKLAHKACSMAFWAANSPFSAISSRASDFTLSTYTAEETANTAGLARSLAKAA